MHMPLTSLFMHIHGMDADMNATCEAELVSILTLTDVKAHMLNYN